MASESGGKEAHDGAGVSLPSPTLDSTPPSSHLDVQMLPHIFHSIISYSSIATLAKLIRCSKHSFDLAKPRLYRHFHLNEGLVGQLAISLSPHLADRKPISQLLTPSNLDSLQLVQHLTLHGVPYFPDAPSWPIPRELSPNLRTIRVLHADPANISHVGFIPSSSTEHVIVRAKAMHPLTLLARPPGLPVTLDRITLLADTVSVSNVTSATTNGFGTVSQTLTVVYIPRDFADRRGMECLAHSRFRETLDRILRLAQHWCGALEIVGLEYGRGLANGFLSASLWRARYDALARKAGAENGRLPQVQSIIFRRFEQWPDGQEEEMMFSEKEEEILRTRSQEHQRRWGDRQCPNVPDI